MRALICESGIFGGVGNSLKGVKHGPDREFCMEECSELIQAISKELRGKSDKNHLAEEMADVMICINMLQEMYEIGTSELESWICSKQQRCKERMVTE